ncbi:uncharacterized protein LOC133533924 isoform X1 [Cydia pomonella]|uniref:uncharacterized protein LOC133533924 isoform X1 n=1 Tax=Cydia pomonella TaxID=82600 RepID=UPI002ADD7D05|nr:uncharacterized protein LOC133533924 isoform X1 [Cydia pomonella]XP_061728993.1 uncharacterized protein LOC133533924 isoform X1 [Cydia pomonella]
MAYPSGAPPAPPVQSLGSTNTVFITETRFDLSYIVTPPGIIKAVLVVLNLLCFICIEASAFRSNGRGVYFVFVSLLGLAFTGGLLLMYLYHVVEKYHNFKWLKVELAGSAALTFLQLAAATLAVAFGDAAYSAAGVSALPAQPSSSSPGRSRNSTDSSYSLFNSTSSFTFTLTYCYSLVVGRGDI